MGLRGDIRDVADGWRWGRRVLPPASVPQGDGRETVFPTDWTRSRPARAARAAVQRFGLAPLLRFEVRASVQGLDVLEALQPPVMFVANHSSHLDAPLVLTSLPRAWRDRTCVGAAADYFFDSWWRGVGTALVFNAFPVERKGGRRGALGAHRLLEEGWNVLVFPQGTRSNDGWITDFHHGAARLALAAGVPVIPIGISGSFQAMPRGRAWPAPGRPPVRVRFGRPVRGDAGEGGRDFSQRVRRALALTLHEERTTWWDALSRDARDELPDASGPDAAKWRRIWEASRPLADSHSARAWRSTRATR
ncbi:MAG: lysophospholipid acyltransferase family protein [Actinomycetota bacterium]